MNLIIFDFDGTIVDSLAIFIEAANRLAKDFGYQPIASSQIPFFRTLSLKETIEQLEIAKWKLPFFLRRFRKELKQSMSDLQLVDGMRETLVEMAQNYRLGIVTSNSRQNVENFLYSQQLNHFEFVYGERVLSGKAKILKRSVALNRVDPRQVIFIGDETRDIKAAKQVGLSNIAVSWGFNTPETLAESIPDVLIERPEQLLAAVEKIHSNTTQIIKC